MHAVIGPRVRVIAPVNPTVDAVEAAQFLVGDGAQLNILKHVCPAAGDLSQIFVPVGHGAESLQVLGVRDESGAQPLRRCLQVGTVVLHLARLAFSGVLVGPVGRAGRRVKALERDGNGAAAEQGLLYVAHLFRPAKLVQFFKMDIGHIAEGQLNGFQIARIVQAEKHDLLPRGQVCQLHGGDRGLPLTAYPQRPRRPNVLVIDRTPQGVLLPAEHHCMGVRVAHHLEFNFFGDKRAFCPTSAAFTQRLGDLAGPYAPVQLKKSRRHHL